jgi:hypothetical protein
LWSGELWNPRAELTPHDGGLVIYGAHTNPLPFRCRDEVSGGAVREDDMAAKFRALLVTKDGDRQSTAVTELMDADLMEAMSP